MALISKLTIQEVNNRLDAIAVIGEYIRLEKKSSRWWGRCPFHAGGQEKTPSFKVDPDLKMYHCFGCGKGGSAISFVMEMENLSYPETIKNLARSMGIEVSYEQGETESADSSIKEELYELYRRLSITFQHFLRENPAALKYLKDRGVNDQMIDQFKLGFSPANRDFLRDFLKRKGYSDDFLGKTGLFSSKYKSIPLFAGRLMFPIADRQGRIVAFGGRATEQTEIYGDGEPPKYINSPETEIYKKGETLFAIDQAKAEMRKTRRVFLAEGYMDVIALHQAGATNSVAPLGTAFTDQQARWLRGWVDKVSLFFDNDPAGQKAAYKTIITCGKNGLERDVVWQSEALKIETGEINTGEFKDPADISLEFGGQILKKILDYTINDAEYLISQALSRIGPDGGRSRVVEFMFPYLEALESDVERSVSVLKIADAARVERDAVLNDYVRWKKEGFAPGKTEEKRSAEATVRRNAEIVLLTVVAVNMELYPEFRAAVEIKEIDDPAAKELFIALEECFQRGESGVEFVLSRIKDEPLKNFILSQGDSPEFRGSAEIDPRRLMEDGLNEIRKKRLRKRLTEIGAEIRQIESGNSGDFGANAGETADIEELLAEKKEIDSMMRNF